MINELDALTEAEEILADHWRYSVLPSERRAIRASMRLETMYAQAQGQPDVVTWADVVLVVLGALLMVVIGMRL